MDQVIIKCIGEYGLTVGILFVFFFLLKWVLDVTKEERIAWRKMIDELRRSMDEHTKQTHDFWMAQQEANKYNREEHKEMISSLGRINGYK